MIFLLDRFLKVGSVLSNANPESQPYSDDDHNIKLEDGYERASFSTPSDYPALTDATITYFGFNDLDGEFRVFKIIRAENDHNSSGESIKTYFGETIAYEIGRGVVRPVTLTGVTAEAGLTHVLQGTGWLVGEVEWLGTNDIPISQHITSLSGVHEVRKVFGGDVKFSFKFDGTQVVAKYVNLYQLIGRDTGKRLTYDKDIRGIRRIADYSDVVTAVVVVGKDGASIKDVEWSTANGDPVDKPLGQDWIGDPDVLQRWSTDGQHIMGIHTVDGESNPAVLIQSGWDHIQKVKYGLFNYEVDALLLERMPGFEHEKVRLGDTVIIKDRDFVPELVLSARAIEISRSKSDHGKDKVIFGNYIPIFSDVSAQIAYIQTILSSTEGKIIESDTEPSPKYNGLLWLKTSVFPHVLYRWNSSLNKWRESSPTSASQLNYSDGSSIEDLKPTEAGADVTGSNTSADTAKVNGVNASEISAGVANFNSRNDRKSTIPANPVVPTDGTAVDHTMNTDGSCDISFEWTFTGSGDAYDIDGFIVFIRSSTSSGAYTFGTTPSEETTYVLPADKRALILPGVPVNKYYTFGVQAYRTVDNDINSSGIIKSSIVKATGTGENPYRPSSSVAFSGNITGTINGTTASTVVANASDGAVAKAKIDGDVGTGTIETTAGSSTKAGIAESNANTYTDKLSTKGLGMKVNYSTFTQANTGELYMHGYNSSGDPADVNGFLIVNGTKLTILKEMINPNAAGDGFIMWDNVTQHWYMVVISSSMVWTRYNAQDVTNHGLSFTPTTDHYFVGVVQSPSSEGTLVATLWNDYKEWTEVEKIVKGFYAESNAVNYADTTYSEAKSLVNGWKFTGKTTINGGQVEADTVTAVQVASRTLTAQEMVIADFTNLSGIDVENPPVSVYIAKYPDATSYHTDGYRYLKIGPNAYYKLNLASSKRVEFAVGDKYYLSFIGWKDTSTSVNFIIRYYYTDASWSNAGTGSITMSGSSSSPGFCEKVVSITAAPTANKTISYVDFFLEKANDTTYYYYARDIELRKMYGGKLIVDGSINANHIEANGIIGATIKTASSGARVELNSTGLKQYDLSGNVIVDMSGGNATFKGTVNTSENAVVGTDLTIGVGGEAGTQRKIIMGSNAQIQSTNNQADLTLACNYVNIPTGYLMIGGQPSARAYINSNFSLTAGVWHTMPAAVKSHDLRGNNYSTTTYKFSCLVDGDYLISASIVATTTATAALDTIVLAVFKNGVFESKISYGSCYNGTVIQTGGSTVIRCLGSDDIEVRVTSSRAATMVNTANNPGNNFVVFALLH